MEFLPFGKTYLFVSKDNCKMCCFQYELNHTSTFIGNVGFWNLYPFERHTLYLFLSKDNCKIFGIYVLYDKDEFW